MLSRLALLPRSMAMQGAKVMINDLKKGVSKGAGAVDAGTRDGDNQEARLVSDGDGVVEEIRALGGSPRPIMTTSPTGRARRT